MDTLKLEREGATLHVVLSRPERHDAFDDRVVADLREAFGAAAEEDGVRVVVLRSTGKSFCAGADVAWMRRMGEAPPEVCLTDALAMEEAFHAVASCPRPVVARVHGAALGGGAGLAAACDVTLASESAVFAFPEVRLGLLPAVIMPYVLRRVPVGRAQALFLTGERFDASRALALGLVDRVVPDGELDTLLAATVADLIAGGPVAQAALKALARAVEDVDRERVRALTARAIADARSGPEGRAGLQAFLDRRKPDWIR